MTKNFVEELKWRGMIHEIMPGTEEMLNKGMTVGYLGIDPTADSLHIGHLVGVMMLKHFQRCGHKPLFLVGGATGMIGDPSGKSDERNLLDEETLAHNQAGIKAQLRKLVDFDSDAPNAAKLVNNYDWMKDQTFLSFVRDIGKMITVNYMMAKDSVKRRFSGEGPGMSFTEFSYQLIQGYDYLHLYTAENCRIQLGGSDQWGNITTGVDMIRRAVQGEAYGIVCPLMRKADGGKFGKTESGNVWLSPEYTSPYKFYQFWLGTSDEDAEQYIKIFTMLDQETITDLINKHREAPHERQLQKRLAQELTVMVHSEEEYENAVSASEILFGKSAVETLSKIDERTLLQVFEGVPQFEISREDLGEGMPLSTLAAEETSVFASKGELRRLVQGGGVSLCGVKVEDPEMMVTPSNLVSGKYLLIQRGKRNYFLVRVNE